MTATCPRCDSSVSENAKFCPECGQPLTARTCPACGAESDHGRFCADCGTPLDGTRTGAAPAVTVPVVGSAAGVARHSAMPVVPTAERRVTTVLFADLVGFTSRSEGSDPEDVRELLSRYFAGASTVVARYGGTVEKFIGDAVMAVWGVPVAHEDDAERAVRAGLELVTMTESLGEDNDAEGLTMRVGLVTGEVAVTLGASGEGMVAGDAVNTAARVQTAAEPGQVWIDEATRNLTAAAIAYEPVGEHQLKGKAEPVRLFAARSVVASVRGIDRVDGLEAPLTGRDRELRLVKELFHGAQEAAHASLVVVEGEPGVGKSRLAWEFEKYVDGLTATTWWHRGRCLAYGEGVAFWALAEAVRGRLGLIDSDSGDVVDQKLHEGLNAFVPDAAEQAWLRPRLAVLIGAPETGATFTPDELYAAWTAFLEHVSGGELVTLVVDDTQHADDGLLDFLEHMLESARFPILVVALARTGLLARRPDLAASRRTTVLHLDPLPEAPMATLLDGLVAELPDHVRDSLVGRSEGIPLFAVETVRSLIDRDLVVPREGRYVLADPDQIDLKTLAAPASLQALVAARLDALSPVERRIVSDASVLGLTFYDDALAALTPDLPARDEVLRSLVHKQILALETDRFSASRGQYRFVQAVVRQVAYDTLSKRDRKARHLAVAAHLELQPDTAGELAPVVAQHYLDALASSASSDPDHDELAGSAIAVLKSAASRASALAAPREALRHLQSALDLTEDPRTRAALLADAGQAAVVAGQWQLAVDLGTDAIVAYEALGDSIGAGLAAATPGDVLSRALSDPQAAIDLMTVHWNRLDGDPNAARARLELARFLATGYMAKGEHEQAGPYVEAALRLAEGLGDKEAICRLLGLFARQLGGTDAPYTGGLVSEAQVGLARELGVPVLLADALVGAGIERHQRDATAAAEMFRAGLAAARQAGSVDAYQLAELNLALALWSAGEWDELEPLADHAQDDSVQFGLRIVYAVLARWLAEARGRELLPPLPAVRQEELDNLSDLAWLEVGQMHELQRDGSLEAASKIGEEAVRHALAWNSVGDDFMLLWPPAARTAIAAGQLDRAAAMLRPVEEAATGLLAPALVAHLDHLRGLLAMARGYDEATIVRSFGAAIDGFAAYASPPLKARAQADLGRWFSERGRTEEAQPLLREAQQTFDELGAGGWLREYDLLSAPVTG